MTYAAVISLKQTITDLLNRPSHFSSSREIWEFAYNETTSLQKVLQRFNDDSSRSSSSKRLDDLEGQIRDCAHQLEDVLEQQENYADDEVRREITSFTETVKEMEVEYILELSKAAVPQDDDHDHDATAVSSSDIDFAAETMVGHSTQFTEIREYLLRRMRPDDVWYFSIFGELGGGRSHIANCLFEDLRRCGQQFFDCFAWVKLGTVTELKGVFVRILAQLDKLSGHYSEMRISKDDRTFSELQKVTRNRRYMIVLDDVRDVPVMEYLLRKLPDQSNGSVVVFTTSSDEVSKYADNVNRYGTPRHFFEETVWISLRSLLFLEESIPPELEEAGKKIVKNCRGLYIPAAKTVLFLRKTEISVEHWRKLAADEQNPIFVVEDEILEMNKIMTEMQSWEMFNLGNMAALVMVSSMVDFRSSVEDIKMKMHPERFFDKMQIISLLGMAGIGKSTFARKIFKDESIISHFDHRVWITLGPKYQAEEILVDILAQIYQSVDKRKMKEDEKLARDLCVKLSRKSCLIVLDDLYSKEPLDHLKNSFPNIKGTTLVTTRLEKVATFQRDDNKYEMRLLNIEESWSLLRQKVFVEGLCPHELESAGRKIAENCDGLPLLIVTVSEQLLRAEMTPEYWNNVASGKQKSIFKNAHQQISKELLPSYESLPQYLKPCFLYIGAFRNNYETSTSKISNLWRAEGFLEPNPPQTVEDFVVKCLSELADRSLIMVQRKISDLQIKTCRLHSVFWHLSNSVAVKNKFFHAMNSYSDCSIEMMENQRRLCIPNSILLGIQDVYDAMESSSKTRALLCTGPPHQYQVPLYFGLTLLRVLDALAIRFYEFPGEVVELVHLRYLGLTCNGKFPTSISKLWKLQYLIVSRYINTKSSSGNSSASLPSEIWDMKELKHLQFMGGCLPNPKRGDILPNLSTLLDVSVQSCTEKVLESIPNLKRLGIQIELAPGEKGNPFVCLNNISLLGRLESLKCVVMNPQIGSEVVAPPAPVSMFPSSLKKLSLSGFGYPWEYMSIIGELRNLEVLKLKGYAFQGPKWDMDDTCQFMSLKFLLLEDTNLVRWELNSVIRMQLNCLSIKHCYKLQHLPLFLGFHHFTKIEIVDCNPLTVYWAEQTRQLSPCEVKAHFSWTGQEDSQLN